MKRITLLALLAFVACNDDEHRYGEIITTGVGGSGSGSGNVSGSGSGSQVAVWSGATSQDGFSTFTCDGSGDVAAYTLNATQSAWTVNSTAAGIFSASTIAIGHATPGAYFDLWYQWGSGKDPFEIVEAGPNTSNGIEIDYVRGYGSAAPGELTSTGVTTSILDMDMFGYSTSNAVELASSIHAMVDQANGSNYVNGDVELWNTVGSGSAAAIAESFRVDSAQHPSTLAPGLPTLASCGTSPSFLNSEATDASGTIVEGSTASGCTLTFRTSWSQVYNGQLPHCVLSSRSGLAFTYTVSATQIVVTNVGSLSSTDIDYVCLGGQTP